MLGLLVPDGIGVFACLAVVEAQLFQTLGEDVFARHLLARVPECLMAKCDRSLRHQSSQCKLEVAASTPSLNSESLASPPRRPVSRPDAIPSHQHLLPQTTTQLNAPHIYIIQNGDSLSSALRPAQLHATNVPPARAQTAHALRPTTDLPERRREPGPRRSTGEGAGRVGQAVE